MKNYIAAVLGSAALMLAVLVFADSHETGFSETPVRVATTNGGTQPQMPIHIA